MSSSLKLGWIGTGVMGVSMCGHLLTAGHSVVVYTRTKSKAQPLLDRGATWGNSPGEVAGQADVVFTMVGSPQDVREVYFGSTGLLAGARPGALAIDLTTTAPSLAQELAADGRVSTLDAPVSGGDIGARNATLSIMVGGAKPAFERALPLLQLLGKTIIHQGPAGAGQHAKLCNQIVITGAMIGVCESLLYGTKAGLDLATMLQSIRGGAAGCWTLDNLAPRILQGNFGPGFSVDHFVKDMGLVLAECRQMNLELPGVQLVHELYRRIQARGLGQKGTQILFQALAEVTPPPGVSAASRR